MLRIIVILWELKRVSLWRWIQTRQAVQTGGGWPSQMLSLVKFWTLTQLRHSGLRKSWTGFGQFLWGKKILRNFLIIEKSLSFSNPIVNFCTYTGRWDDRRKTWSPKRVTMWLEAWSWWPAWALGERVGWNNDFNIRESFSLRTESQPWGWGD